ncbi:MAG: phospholipid/cholesterol/gamma-HCH transport system substrate-binding protein [Actinomycetota bacterium]|jgi:phospholipid/cholesterol/gamma-HCH transport system substrate-binding protein|nr:phospholipid/cholesterol/gamma-HCH transport system substrate-binding protein [Actinomycetota bacterium]
MIGRSVVGKLLVFAVVTVLGVGYVLVHYIGAGRTLLGQSYTAYVDLPDSGGIFTTASVTYRGVEIGRVGAISLRDDGIRVALDLNSRPQIPTDVRAVIGNGSALGEQYVDLQPATTKGPYLRQGSVIPADHTSLPVSTETLLVDLDKLVKSVPNADLRTLVNELGTGFDETGPALRRLLDATDSLSSEANLDAPDTVGLLESGRTVLDTQNDLSNDIVAFSQHLASFSQVMRSSDGDLRHVLTSGIGAAGQVTALEQSVDATLPITLGNLVSLGQVTAVRVPAVRQVLIIYPYIVATSFGLFPGDGTTRFGVPVPPSEDSQPCTTGYVPPSKRRLPSELNYPPIRYGAYCKEPSSSSVGPRGSRQAPEPDGKRLADEPSYKNNTGLPSPSPSPGAAPSSFEEPAGTGLPATTLSGPGAGGYVLGSTGGRREPWGDQSWKALILGPLS